MKCSKDMMLLYAVTDRKWVGEMSLYQQVEVALKKGITCLQLREKELDERTFLEEALQIGELCRAYKVPFIINDNIEIALKCRADGIHIGQEDVSLLEARKLVGNEMMIGVSVHTVHEAIEAMKNGADYLGVGAVFHTSTKLDVNTMSYETLKAICEITNLPTVAIGGIAEKNIMKLCGSGIDGIAVISAIFGAQNPGEATMKLLALAKEMVQHNQ